MILVSQRWGSWALHWGSEGICRPAALRRAARQEKDGLAAARMYAIAHALEGMSRAEAARLVGMERQALGAPVVTVLESGPVRFRAGLDPALAARLEPGARVVIETGAGAIPARLAHLAPELDPATRSRAALSAVEGAAPPARATGEVALTDRVAEPGAWMPLAALRPGPKGTWTLLTVEEEGDAGPVIGEEAAEIVHLAWRSRASPR